MNLWVRSRCRVCGALDPALAPCAFYGAQVLVQGHGHASCPYGAWYWVRAHCSLHRNIGIWRISGNFFFLPSLASQLPDWKDIVHEYASMSPSIPGWVWVAASSHLWQRCLPVCNRRRLTWGTVPTRAAASAATAASCMQRTAASIERRERRMLFRLAQKPIQAMLATSQRGATHDSCHASVLTHSQIPRIQGRSEVFFNL